ncbi:MAG: T9SS type A sorting domain-containing protein [Bacteroidetes bacterium]|nr:T9SS type A sorting domain-containing protein [Bacteroidota bacterium]
MKKILPILILLSLRLCAFTQAPVLDSANIVHKDGDSIFYWDGNINYYDPGNSGANVFWDFSSVNFTIPVTSPAQLTYSMIYSDPPTYYPTGCNLVDFSMSPVGNEIKRYYLADINKLVAMGEATTPVAEAYYLPSRYIFKFPFTYLSGFLDSTNYQSDFQPGPNTTKHNRKFHYSVVADGWGSLKILNKTHTNVIRVRTINQWTDTSTLYSNNIPYFTNSYYGIDTIYSWYKPNTYEALLSMSTGWQDSSGVWINHKSGYISPYGLEYLPCFVGVNENTIFKNISVSPNPAREFFNVYTNERISRVEVLDFRGILLKTFLKPKVSEEYYVGNLLKGLYFVRIYAEGMVDTFKLVKY